MPAEHSMSTRAAGPSGSRQTPHEGQTHAHPAQGNHSSEEFAVLVKPSEGEIGREGAITVRIARLGTVRDLKEALRKRWALQHKHRVTVTQGARLLDDGFVLQDLGESPEVYVRVNILSATETGREARHTVRTQDTVTDNVTSMPTQSRRSPRMADMRDSVEMFRPFVNSLSQLDKWTLYNTLLEKTDTYHIITNTYLFHLGWLKDPHSRIFDTKQKIYDRPTASLTYWLLMYTPITEAQESAKKEWDDQYAPSLSPVQAALASSSKTLGFNRRTLIWLREAQATQAIIIKLRDHLATVLETPTSDAIRGAAPPSSPAGHGGRARNEPGLHAPRLRPAHQFTIAVNLNAVMEYVVPVFFSTVKFLFALFILSNRVLVFRRHAVYVLLAAHTWIAVQIFLVYRLRRNLPQAQGVFYVRDDFRGDHQGAQGLNHLQPFPPPLAGGNAPPNAGVNGAAAALRPGGGVRHVFRQPHPTWSPRYWQNWIAAYGLAHEARELGLVPRSVAGRPVRNPESGGRTQGESRSHPPTPAGPSRSRLPTAAGQSKGRTNTPTSTTNRPPEVGDRVAASTVVPPVRPRHNTILRYVTGLLIESERPEPIRKLFVGIVIFFGSLLPEVERKRKRALEKRERLVAERRIARDLRYFQKKMNSHATEKSAALEESTAEASNGASISDMVPIPDEATADEAATEETAAAGAAVGDFNNAVEEREDEEEQAADRRLNGDEPDAFVALV